MGKGFRRDWAAVAQREQRGLPLRLGRVPWLQAEGQGRCASRGACVGPGCHGATRRVSLVRDGPKGRRWTEAVRCFWLKARRV